MFQTNTYSDISHISTIRVLIILKHILKHAKKILKNLESLHSFVNTTCFNIKKLDKHFYIQKFVSIIKPREIRETPAANIYTDP